MWTINSFAVLTLTILLVGVLFVVARSCQTDRAGFCGWCAPCWCGGRVGDALSESSDAEGDAAVLRGATATATCCCMVRGRMVPRGRLQCQPPAVSPSTALRLDAPVLFFTSALFPLVQGIVRLAAPDAMVAQARAIDGGTAAWWDRDGNWTIVAAFIAVAGWLSVVASWAILPVAQRAAWRASLGI